MDAEANLSPTDKLLYLGRMAWSRTRLPLALGRLSIAAEHVRERAFPRGAALAREGEPMASFYLLVRGRVHVSRRGAVLGEAEPGSLVGLEAVLSQDHLGLGVVAVDGRAGAAGRLRHAAGGPGGRVPPGARRHRCRHAAPPRARAAAARATGRLDGPPVPSPGGPAHEPRRGAALPADPGRALRTRVEHRRPRGAGRRLQAGPVPARARLLERGRACRTHRARRRGECRVHLVAGCLAALVARGPRPVARDPGSGGP